MFKIVILICNFIATPNAADCNTITAVQQFETPHFASQLACNTGEWEPWLSKLAIKPNLGKEYPKTICQRVQE